MRNSLDRENEVFETCLSLSLSYRKKRIQMTKENNADVYKGIWVQSNDTTILINLRTSYRHMTWD